MAYKGLKDYIDVLEKNNQLIRISTPVSAELEITEIADRVSKANGPALLFEKVDDTKYPLLINAFGSYERMSLSLGADSLDSIGEDIREYLNITNYTSFKGIMGFIPQLFRLLRCFPIKKPIKIKRPACQQVVERDPDLSTLPVLKCWPLDGGRFFTLPLVFTKYYGSKNQNVGMYRMQVIDKNTTAMHWHKHKDGRGIYDAYRKNKKKMPVAVALGCDPAITYAATAPLPPKIDEMFLAGFLRKRNVPMVKCVTCDIYVPENAEIVIEGYVDPEEELVWEGPFGDHTGYYSLADWYPKFHVTCITHKKDAIYPATIVGKPPMEDCYMAKATERIFLPILQFQMPELVNINLPLEGVFHNCAIVSVKNAYPGVANTIMSSIWGMGQMRYTKMIIAVDEEVDPYDTGRVIQEILKNSDFEKDIILSKGPLDALDHSSDEAFYGTRIGVNAMSKKNFKDLDSKYRIISVNKEKCWDGKRKAEAALEEYSDKLIIVVDDSNDIRDISTVMWRVFNNIDGSRDLIIKEGRAAIDATKKLIGEGLTRPWPEDIVMTEEIKDMVDKKWESYGIK